MASPEYHAEEIAEVSFLKSNLFWLCWVLVAVHGLSLVVESGGYSWLWCAGFSPRWRFLLQSTGSRLEAVARGPSNCRQASLLRGMWNLPRAGLEPLSPVLTGGSVHCTTREAPCRFDNSERAWLSHRYSHLRGVDQGRGICVSSQPSGGAISASFLPHFWVAES